MHFTKTERAVVIKDHPEIAKQQSEIGKVLGQKWKELSAEEKKPYEKLAAEDKARYEKEIAEYNKSK